MGHTKRFQQYSLQGRHPRLKAVAVFAADEAELAEAAVLGAAAVAVLAHHAADVAPALVAGVAGPAVEMVLHTDPVPDLQYQKLHRRPKQGLVYFERCVRTNSDDGAHRLVAGNEGRSGDYLDGGSLQLQFIL